MRLTSSARTVGDGSTLQRVPASPRLVADSNLSPIAVPLETPDELANRSLVVVDRELFRLLPRSLKCRDGEGLLVCVDPNPGDNLFHDRLPSHAALALTR
jgi:hypothetical protein